MVSMKYSRRKKFQRELPNVSSHAESSFLRQVTLRPGVGGVAGMTIKKMIYFSLLKIRFLIV